MASEPGRREISALARDTPIVCKLSGLVTEAGSSEAAVLTECVDHLLASFGPRRMMWGSDWPVCELVCSYDTWRATSDVLLRGLDAAAREQIDSGVARTTYGI